MKYPWVLQIDVVTKVWWFLVAVSKLESWLMAHFEATLMYITNNHFKTLLRAIWGIYGPKTVKNSLKMSQIDNFPEFLAIKWERKVLQTQFWYQKKALAE